MFKEFRIRTGNKRGLTFIELTVAVALLVVLASAALPLYHWNEKRRKEGQLQMGLVMIRRALDQYHKYAEEGLIIQDDVDQMFYPLELEALTDGVEVGDPQSPDAKEIRFLAKIPENPFTGLREWGLRSYQDDWDSTSWGGENIYDVYSDFDGKALDGSYYQDW